MPSADVLQTVHGLTQAVWDARQLFAHLRQRTSQPIGLMGLSLGGLVSALVASIDEPHAVVLLIPAVDLPSLMRDAAERIPSDLAADPVLLEQAAAISSPRCPRSGSPPRCPSSAAASWRARSTTSPGPPARPRPSGATGTNPPCTGTTAGTCRCSGPAASRPRSTGSSAGFGLAS